MKLTEQKSFIEWMEEYFYKVSSPQSNNEITYPEKEHWEDIPIVTIRLRDLGYELEIDMPGFEKEEISTRVSHGRLQVSAHKKERLKQA